MRSRVRRQGRLSMRLGQMGQGFTAMGIAKAVGASHECENGRNCATIGALPVGAKAQGLRLRRIRAMPMIKLLSHASGRKPETVVTGEAEGLWERPQGVAVHCREIDEDCPTCTQCGAFASVWFGSRDKWQSHPQRCSQS